MGVVITRTKTLGAASATAICASQTPAGAGNLTIDGSAATAGVATLDTQRRVLFTFAGNETGHTFVVYGTNQDGAAISESVAGTAPGTTATNLDFLTVTRISIDAAATGAMTVGTNGVGSTNWQSVDLFQRPTNIGFQVIVSGTVNYTIESTNFDVNSLPTGISYPTPFAHPTIAAQTTSKNGAYSDPIAGFRLTVNSGDGTAYLTYQQTGPEL